MNITVSKDKQLTVKGTVTCFRISLSQQSKENAVVCCLLVCVRARFCLLACSIRHTSRRTVNHSPDLAPSGFHLFWLLKGALWGPYFQLDEELKQLVHEWLAEQPKDFLSRGIYALVEHWSRFVECGGNYIED